MAGMSRSDNLIRYGTGAAVLLVAGIAAVVSFQHIQHLALTHGQTSLAAALLPLSIDGTVAAASLVMLRAARTQLATPVLARFMLALAVVATLAANVGYGLPYGVPGALLSGWPAVAFIGCAEMAILMVRKTAQPAAVTGKGSPAKPPLPPHRQVRTEYQAGDETAKKILAAIRTRDRTWQAAFNGNGGVPHE